MKLTGNEKTNNNNNYKKPLKRQYGFKFYMIGAEPATPCVAPQYTILAEEN